MGKPASAVYENAKPAPSRDRLIGYGDGLFLRVRPHGTKTWVIEYEFQGRRTKYTIGGYSRSLSDLAIAGRKTPQVRQAASHVLDFRRTLITRLPYLGFEPFLGHKIANHVFSGVFAHYNHNTYESQREKALAAWAARLETLVMGSNVVQLRRVA